MIKEKICSKFLNSDEWRIKQTWHVCLGISKFKKSTRPVTTFAVVLPEIRSSAGTTSMADQQNISHILAALGEFVLVASLYPLTLRFSRATPWWNP